MLNPVGSASFKRDVARMQKRNKDMTKLRKLVLLLTKETPLPAAYKSHPLKGDYAGYRDAHIEPDWVLIYGIKGNDLYLYRTGSHADILE